MVTKCLKMSMMVSLVLVLSMSVMVMAKSSMLETEHDGRRYARSTHHNPIVIVPGTGGMQLEAKLTKPSTVGWYCTKTTTSFFTLWLNPTSLLPYSINCWMDNMRLEWDLKTFEAKNSPGVETRVPGFGETSSIEHLDSLGLVKYFSPIVDYLASLGYRRGKDLRGAPYDFRYTPASQPNEYNKRLRQLIEDTYENNGNQSIALISHSYGAMITMHFLHSVDDQWKQKYIQQWISISGVFGGTIKQILLYASGDNFGIPDFLVDPLTVRDEQRTSTSNLFMMPIKQLWRNDEVLVTTTTRKYTIDDMADFFKDIEFPQGYKMAAKIGDGSQLMRSVGVPVACFYGNIAKSTEDSMVYKGAFPRAVPEVVKGDGDGTVNKRSLEYCMNIEKLQKQQVSSQVFDGQTHNGIFDDTRLQQAIKEKLI